MSSVLRRSLPPAALSWWDRYVVRSRIPTLAIRVAHIQALAGLPDLHKDPFDRILMAQAIAEDLVLASRDRDLARYGIRVIW
jgi:PIN domain nuclease of toxin-antitoxin system